jgi:hypothetical protein
VGSPVASRAVGYLLSSIRRLAVCKERISYDLCCLPSRGVVVSPEVWQIAASARYPGATTRIPTDDSTRGQTLYIVVEGRAWQHVLKELSPGRIVEAGSIGDYLADLPSRGVVVSPEVWQIAASTRLTNSSAGVAANVAPRREASDIELEGRAEGHICKELGRLWLRETCCIGDDL